MAIDRKYGRVTTEHGTIGEDEPVVVFRAQDRLLPKLLKVYKILCELAGSPPHHLAAIHDAAMTVRAWQAENPTKTPSSDSLAPLADAVKGLDETTPIDDMRARGERCKYPECMSLDAALADAGLLLPLGAEVREEWGYRSHLRNGTDHDTSCFDVGGERYARSLVAQGPADLKRVRGRSLIRRFRYIGPWREVADASE